MAGPPVYTLTDLTGRNKNAGRTMIISGIEVGRRTLIVFAGSLVASLLPTVILFGFVHAWALITLPPAFIAAGFILVEGRSRQGLQLRRYQSMLDKQKADPATFFICFQPADEQQGFARIVRSNEPAVRPLVDAPSAIFTNSRRVRAGKGKPA